MTLKHKAVTAVFWNVTERFGNQGIRFIIGIILARLLTPQDYGLIGIVTVFFLLADVFIESGFGSAYVQKRNATSNDANTIFYFNLLTSLLLYVLLWFTAQFIADFYKEVILVKLIRVMGIIVILNAFSIIQIAHLKKNMNFKLRTYINLAASLISGVVGVSAALKGMGVWSLVLQQILNSFIKSASLWFTSSFRPSLAFSVESFKKLFSFGGWILIASMVQTLFDNIYVLVIGRIFPLFELGFYTKAKSFQNLSALHLTNAVGEVSFPVFSKIQDDKVRLKGTMRVFLQQTMLIIVPVLSILIVVADPFVKLLLTDKWTPMVPYLRLLCIAGLLFPIHLINIQVLIAQGKSELNFLITLIKNGLRVLNLIVSYRYGIYYIILGEIILSFVALFINGYFTKKMISYGISQQLIDLKYSLIDIGIILIIGYSVNQFFNNLIFQFLLTSLMCLLSYVAIQIIYRKTNLKFKII